MDQVAATATKEMNGSHSLSRLSKGPKEEAGLLLRRLIEKALRVVAVTVLPGQCLLFWKLIQ